MRLYTKVVLCITPIFLAGAWAAVYSARKAVHQAEFADLMKVSLFEVREIVPDLAKALKRRDAGAIQAQLQELARNIGDSSSVALYDAGGRVAARTKGAEDFASVDPEVAAVFATGAPLTRELSNGGGEAAVIVIPVQPSSAVRVEIPLDNLQIREREIARILLRIIGVFGGLAAILLGLIIRRLLAPIGMLLASAERIRHGEYGAPIVVGTSDEIGVLARGFNAMSQALAATTVSKDFFDNILKTMQDPLIVADNEGRITMANPAVPALLGYAAGELIGLPAASLFESGDDVLQRAEAGSSAEGVRSAKFQRKDGQKTPVLLSLSRLRDADDKEVGLVISAKDVSEVKKMEGRMQQSEKLSAVGQLAAGVAHEINNPLGVILGFSQGMARQMKAGDPLELPIKSIEREALRCKNLVQDLLTFARTSQTDREGMDLNRVIEQALTLVQSQVRMGSVQMKVDLGTALPMILGNKNQIQQVVLNLAKNALDAMPAGGALTIKTELVESAPQSWVCLEISDTGAGIPPELQARIFEPFFTTKAVGQGTGLGLSLVSEIVKKHSGEIDLVSAPGRTVFRVKFPARTGREIAQRASELQLEKLSAPVVYSR